MKKSKILVFLLILLPLMAMKCDKPGNANPKIEADYLTKEDYEKMSKMSVAESEKFRKEKESIYHAEKKLKSIEGSSDTAKMMALTTAITEYDKGNFEKAFVMFHKLLPQADAQYYLGEMYLKGEGVEGNIKEARKYLEAAADKDHSRAMLRLGQYYGDKLGMMVDNLSPEENDRLALYWVEKSVEKGNPEAAFVLAQGHEHGLWLKKDLNKALEWYQKAVDMNYSEAMFRLGGLYLDGKKVPKDTEKGLSLVKKAAENGNYKAAQNLGLIYYLGSGVDVDYVEAISWFEIAAEQDETRAMLFLGKIYAEGLGVPVDREEAQKWYQKANDLGDPRAEEYLEELEK